MNFNWLANIEQAQLPHRNRATRYVSKFVLFHEVWKLERFQTAKVTFKVIQGHWLWFHSIGHRLRLHDFPLVFHATMSLSCTVSDIYHLHPKIKEVGRGHLLVTPIPSAPCSSRSPWFVPHSLSRGYSPARAGLTDDSSQLTFLPSSKSRDRKTRTSITNPARSNLDIVH